MTTSPAPSNKPSSSGDRVFIAFIVCLFAFLFISPIVIIGWALHQNSQLSQDTVPVGQITVAPEPAVVVPPAPVLPEPAVAPAPTARILTNSTLYGMAKRLCGDGNRWSDIAELNLIDGSPLNPDKLQIGQELKLPADCQADTRSVSPAKKVIAKLVLAPPKEQSQPVVSDDDELPAPELPAAVTDLAVTELSDDDELLLPAAVTVEPNPQWPACNGDGYTDEYFISTIHAPRLEEEDKWATYCRSQAGAVTTAQIDRANHLIADWQVVEHFVFGRPFMGGEYRQARAVIKELRHSKRSNAFDASYTLLVAAPVPDVESLWSLYGQRSAHSKWARTFFPYVKQYGEASDEPIVEERPRSKKQGTPAGSE